MDPILWPDLTMDDYLADKDGARTQLARLTDAALAKIELYLWLKAMNAVPYGTNPLFGGSSLAELVLGDRRAA